MTDSPSLSEQDRVRADLRYVMRLYDWDADSECASAIVAWHMQAITAAKSEVWIPGLSKNQDPVVEKALHRFYDHHIKTKITQLANENADLKLKILAAISCINFYAFGSTDAGLRAKNALRALMDRHKEFRRGRLMSNPEK